MQALKSILGHFVPKALEAVDEYIHTDEEKRAAKDKILALAADSEKDDANRRAQVVQSEIKSKHKLAGIWRAIAMLMITLIVGWEFTFRQIVNVMFGVDIPPSPQWAVERMFDLLNVGIGGYVVKEGVKQWRCTREVQAINGTNIKGAKQ